jgi:hypothetical protein
MQRSGLVQEKRDPESRRTSGGQPTGNTLLEALTCELHWSALQIGGIASVLNACLARGQARIPNSCRNNFPVESPVVSAALASWGEFEIQKATKMRCERLFKDLSLAKQSTEPFIGGSTAGLAESMRAISQLTAVWRTLSNDAIETINALEPETRWQIGGLYSENTLVLNPFLKDAVRGKFECVDLQGEAVLPVLPQRRKAHRFNLQQACKIVVRSRRVPGFAQDVSMYGIGLSCDFPFSLKESVLVELQTGRSFKGIVAWSKNGRLGVQLDAALSRNDPLISS